MERKVQMLLTLVYWNDSCRPVNVDSIDWGVVSISHVPSAVQNAEQECFNLWSSLENRHCTSKRILSLAEVKLVLLETVQMVCARAQPLAQLTRHWTHPLITAVLVVHLITDSEL